MKHSLKLAAQSLKMSDFDGAKQILEKKSNDEKELYWLSLIYRYEDQYDQEKDIVEKSLQLDSNNSYMQERLAWHNLSLYEKQVPRQQIFIKDEQSWRNEFLAHTTIVSGCDSSQMDFKLLVDMLRSLHSLAIYKNVDISILDCGMTDDQKHFLVTHFSIKNVVLPNCDVPIKSGHINKEMIARPFIPECFPGYKYYVHLDADTWIQDENVLDKYFLLSQRQEIALSSHFGDDVKFFGEWGCDQGTIAPAFWYLEFFKKIPFCNAGVFCIRHPSHIFEQYKECLLANLSQCGASHASEQSALNCVVSKNWPLEILLPQHNCLIHCHLSKGDLEKDGPIILWKKQSIGIIHLSGRLEKTTLYPHLQSLYDINTEKKEKTSFYFSVWPWQDKPEIKKLLQKEANDVLGSL